MSYTNLINVLSDADKKTLTEYIGCFGVRKEDFIGVDAWLEQWSHSNQILYKLLGNQLIREFDFEFEKPKEKLSTEIGDKLLRSKFKDSYHTFYHDVILPMCEKEEINFDHKYFFNHLLDRKNFINDKIETGIKYKAPSAKKMLQIQAGAKPLRAITRVMEYFKNEFTFEGFEDFRVQHSLIMNDKVIKDKLCVSIHPMDFITMSDNASKWSSCMSWERDGCYRVGTIEMMNSNNVVCVYLKNSSTPFTFCSRNTGEVVGEWNNKQWRQLFYINKNIIMSGKAYPYIQEDTTRFMLDKLKELAEENLGWTYSFGIEPYKDMLHVTNMNRMENQRTWMKAKSHNKNNIIWDTKGMYNDMLNDNTYPYLCYRNKVDNTKIYSVSGKCNCLKCGKSIVTFNKNEDSCYNERYNNTGAVLCWNCYDSYDGCDYCDTYAPTLNTFELRVLDTNDTIRLCNDCLTHRVKICPCCGKAMYLTYMNTKIVYSPKNYDLYKNLRTINDNGFYILDPLYRDKEVIEKELDEDLDYIEMIYLCEECQGKIITKAEDEEQTDFIKLTAHNRWGGNSHYYFIDPKKYESWRYYNLKAPERYDVVIYTAV